MAKRFFSYAISLFALVTMDAIPSMDTVGLPIYPQSILCTEMKIEGMMPTKVLASAEPIEAVTAWYMEQEGLNWSDQWGMFYVGDEYVMMQSETVLLQDISANPQASACGNVSNSDGMNTQISISYKPKSDS